MTLITAADRRKIRVAKVLQQRGSKVCLLSCTSRSSDNSDTDSSDIGIGGRFVSTRSHEGVVYSSQDIKRERRIRNRESAIRYRQRKQTELELLSQRIQELESENHILKSRIIQYEKLRLPIECHTTMEPAII